MRELPIFSSYPGDLAPRLRAVGVYDRPTSILVVKKEPCPRVYGHRRIDDAAIPHRGIARIACNEPDSPEPPGCCALRHILARILRLLLYSSVRGSFAQLEESVSIDLGFVCSLTNRKRHIRRVQQRGLRTGVCNRDCQTACRRWPPCDISARAAARQAHRRNPN